MIDYQPLADSELEYLKRSDQRILRRAAAEIQIRRAARAPSLRDLAVGVMIVVGLGAIALVLRGRGIPSAAPAPPAAACAHADEQLRMARVYLQRGRPSDVEDAALVLAAVAPWQGVCRDDDAVTHALERAARGGDRVRSLELVEAVLRSGR